MQRDNQRTRMSAWRGLYLAPLFFFTAYLALMGLIVGSLSIQWFASIILMLGSLVLFGMLVGAGYAISRGLTIRPWMIRYFASFFGMVLIVVISWHIADAIWGP